VEVLGVVMNQIREHKFEKVKTLAKIALDNMGLKLLGVIPRQSTLSAPTMYQIKEHLRGELLNANDLLDTVQDVIVGAMTAHHALKYIKKDTLLLTPGDREDLILAGLLAGRLAGQQQDSLSGIILTGGIKPHKSIQNLIQRSNIPVIAVKEETYQTASKVHDLLVKIAPGEEKKIKLARKMVRQYVDIDYIVNNL